MSSDCAAALMVASGAQFVRQQGVHLALRVQGAGQFCQAQLVLGLMTRRRGRLDGRRRGAGTRMPILQGAIPERKRHQQQARQFQ